MRVCIELRAGNKLPPRQSDIQENIDALKRVSGIASDKDIALIRDTISVMEAIKKRLPA